MPGGKKLRYRISVRYESDHFTVASSPEEAVELWQKELNLPNIPYRIKEKEWIKGGYRLVIEFQEHLNQLNRDLLGESISISDIDKSGQPIQ